MDFFFNSRFPPVASIFWLKNELKLPAKTMVFVSSREKSDWSRATSLNVCSCSVSEFELQRFTKVNVSVSIFASIIRTLPLIVFTDFINLKLVITVVTNHDTARTYCVVLKKYLSFKVVPLLIESILWSMCFL